MRIILISLAACFLCSCANVSTTRFEFIDPSGSKVIVEMPKEVEATDLKVSIDAIKGIATIEATQWTTLNVETIKAQSDRESGFSEAVSKGAVEGAMKGLMPTP
jgi:hypothetical protein